MQSSWVEGWLFHGVGRRGSPVAKTGATFPVREASPLVNHLTPSARVHNWMVIIVTFKISLVSLRKEANYDKAI